MDLPWSHDVSQILYNYHVDPKVGLSEGIAQQQQKKYGQNLIRQNNRLTWPKILARQFKSPMVILLGAACFVAWFLEEKLDALTILGILLINSIIGFIQEFKTENSLRALTNISSPKGRVLRNGKILEIKAEKLVPGDILVFEAGDYILGDARIVEANQLSLDESILTGESLPVDKNIVQIPSDSSLPERTNMVFAGTAVSSGSGKAIVTAIGSRTEIGKIASMLKTTNVEATPLQIKLAKISNRLAIFGVGIIAFTVLTGLFEKRPFKDIILSALSLSIAAIPEGLPTVVTLALVLAVYRLTRKKALIRKLDSVETLGSTDIICTDKTGTLTYGKMKVRNVYLSRSQDEQLLLENMVLCNNASVGESDTGDATEVALLKFAGQAWDVEHIRRTYQRSLVWNFDSNRKRMSVAVKTLDGIRVLTKGAPESILAVCKKNSLNDELILDRVSSMSKKGMRVLAFAFKDLPLDGPHKLNADEVETGLNFIGLVAISDPPREKTIFAIKKCQDAGIRVIMMTGDHPLTAEAIGRELGILTLEAQEIITGQEVDRLSETQLMKRIEKIAIFARVSPENKLKLIKALKGKGHIVAMTGDGVNDGPALKHASIGISMGEGGTEVARQASSMILMNDDFSTIVDAIEEGRALHGNIRRTLQYLLSHNLAELIFISTATILGWPMPLHPVNLLWLNLVTDGVPALALASESVPKNFLEQSRRSSSKTFLDKGFYQEMLFIAFIITLMYSLLFKYALVKFDYLSARSYAFSFMVYVGLFRSLSCRSEKMTFFEMKMNWPLLLSVVLPLCFQLGIQQSSLLLEIFKVKSLSLYENALLLGLAPVPVTIIELKKLWARRKHKGGVSWA